ncbi:MAG: hypothetical protein R3F18_19965 [Lysobacterales bacterium]
MQRALGRTPAALPQVEFVGAKAMGDVYALRTRCGANLGSMAPCRAMRSSYRRFDATAMVRAMVFNRHANLSQAQRAAPGWIPLPSRSNPSR